MCGTCAITIHHPASSHISMTSRSGGQRCIRVETRAFARNRLIPHVDELDVWSLWCFRVRPGYRKQGVSHALIEGAVAYARERGAPAIEGYPVDNHGEKVDLTMAYVGTKVLFEKRASCRRRRRTPC